MENRFESSDYRLLESIIKIGVKCLSVQPSVNLKPLVNLACMSKGRKEPGKLIKHIISLNWASYDLSDIDHKPVHTNYNFFTGLNYYLFEP